MNPDDSSITAEQLIAQLQKRSGAVCVDCGAPLCFHAMLFNLAFGFQGQPHCPACLARRMEIAETDLGARLGRHIRARDCFHAAWLWAGREERERRQDAFAERCPVADLAKIPEAR